MDWIYSLDILDGAFVGGAVAAGVAVLVVLVAARSDRWRVQRLLLAAAAGTLVGLTFFVSWDAADALGLYLPEDVGRLLMATCAAGGVAIACLWDRQAWRRALAAAGVLVIAVSGGAAVNAYFGYDRTLGALAGVSTGPPIDLGALPQGAGPVKGAAAGKLLSAWTPPAGMPAVGRRGTVQIPSNGFAARRAGVYLPPAALTAHPVRLPLVVLMMGYPGTPDPGAVANVLDAFAAAHRGLAPIVVVADQIGTKGDPACADSTTYGPAESYILDDVIPWARRTFSVLGDAAHTAIGGYSNGGACAFKLAAERPALFGAMFSVSGEEYPGAESPQAAIADVFHGDVKAFDAAKPAAILARHHGRYSHITAVFTVGSGDPTFTPGVRRAEQAAKAAGMAASFRTVPGAGHVHGAIGGGFRTAFEVLLPVLGLGGQK
ncbi:enterochelin esterase-like enzyme [Sinomonas atrocyanea]|uniref:alpha/beta hydrolase n=1 Tax=Sinomonas atrocyanea TaxID=37927 RepID=UPI002783FD2A|nr:alpha/beta hydrolase-fold protein [Sinomonas atrocyanea]MDP9884905.1 enterochelin esterase-like enzyme [Sinomonas atrocyanea]